MKLLHGLCVSLGLRLIVLSVCLSLVRTSCDEPRKVYNKLDSFFRPDSLSFTRDDADRFHDCLVLPDAHSCSFSYFIYPGESNDKRSVFVPSNIETKKFRVATPSTRNNAFVCYRAHTADKKEVVCERSSIATKVSNGFVLSGWRCELPISGSTQTHPSFSTESSPSTKSVEIFSLKSSISPSLAAISRNTVLTSSSTLRKGHGLTNTSSTSKNTPSTRGVGIFSTKTGVLLPPTVVSGDIGRSGNSTDGSGKSLIDTMPLAVWVSLGLVLMSIPVIVLTVILCRKQKSNPKPETQSRSVFANEPEEPFVVVNAVYGFGSVRNAASNAGGDTKVCETDNDKDLADRDGGVAENSGDLTCNEPGRVYCTIEDGWEDLQHVNTRIHQEGAAAAQYRRRQSEERSSKDPPTYINIPIYIETPRAPHKAKVATKTSTSQSEAEKTSLGSSDRHAIPRLGNRRAMNENKQRTVVGSRHMAETDGKYKLPTETDMYGTKACMRSGDPASHDVMISVDPTAVETSLTDRAAQSQTLVDRTLPGLTPNVGGSVEYGEAVYFTLEDVVETDSGSEVEGEDPVYSNCRAISTQTNPDKSGEDAADWTSVCPYHKLLFAGALAQEISANLSSGDGTGRDCQHSSVALHSEGVSSASDDNEKAEDFVMEDTACLEFSEAQSDDDNYGDDDSDWDDGDDSGGDSGICGVVV